MKNLIRLLVYFSIIKSINNPFTLYSYSLQSIRTLFDKESVGIISRIYPDFFESENSPEYSGLFDLLFSKEISKKEIDLSDLNLERIPIKIASKMKKIEKLDLSDNPDLKLNEEWFTYFYDNLKELSLNNCNLTNENLKGINRMKSLERLNLSGKNRVCIKTLEPILLNLKHLDVSYSNFHISELEYILSCTNKLESLDFSGNDLSNQSVILSALLKNSTLKILNLSRCGLEFQDIENIVHFSNLEEIDLSSNYLSDYEILENSEESFREKPESDFNFEDSTGKVLNDINQIPSFKSKLKKINMNHCFLRNNKFIKSLFDIEGLEVLNLEACKLDFDMKGITDRKAKDSLKELNVSFCGIRTPETFKYLTSFKKLEKLDVSGNIFENLPIDFSFGQAKYSLKDLNISACDLNSFGFRAITEFTCLEKLNLSWTDLSNITPTDLSVANLKKTLKELNLEFSSINHVWFKLFTDCPKLEKFDFTGNDFSLLTKEYSLGCSKESLKEINLKSSQINNDILLDITDCPRLEKLNVSYNSFNDLPNNFKFGRSKESLKELYMNDTKLNSSGLIAISECKKIERLWINENNFYNLPDNFNFGALELSLKELRLFDSNIYYSCLSAISKCKKLEILDIRFNDNLDMDDTRVSEIIETLKNSAKEIHY